MLVHERFSKDIGVLCTLSFKTRLQHCVSGEFEIEDWLLFCEFLHQLASLIFPATYSMLLAFPDGNHLFFMDCDIFSL